MLRSLVIQTIVFVVIFNAMSMLREMDMLSTNGDLAPALQPLKTLNGDTVSLLPTGNKTVIYFFAPWCQVCNFSIDNLQSFQEKNPQLSVIAIALDYADIKNVEKFTRNHQLTFPVVLGNENIKRQFKVLGYPSYYVLNEENRIIARSLGYSSELGLYLRSL